MPDPDRCVSWGQMGFPMDRLEGAFPHPSPFPTIFDGLASLMLQAWMAGGRGAPLPIHGPPGTGEVVDGFCCRLQDRPGPAQSPITARYLRGPAASAAHRANSRPRRSQAASFYDADGVTVTASGCRMTLVEHAYAYRVNYKGRSVVDQRRPQVPFRPGRISPAAHDVLFHEALNPDLVGQDRARRQKRWAMRARQKLWPISHPIMRRPPKEAAKVAEAPGCARLV